MAEHKNLTAAAGIKTMDESVEINGLRQSLMTMCTDENNPVLLIVHGGSGTPDRPLVQHFSKELAEVYTVVCWDQRGSGFSYTKEPFNIDMLLADLKAVVEYLRNKYRQDKIYIAGHSWGAYLGLRFTALFPDYVKYYIGTGQFIASSIDEIERFRFVREQALKNKDLRTVRKLDAFGAPEGYRYPTHHARAKSYVATGVFQYHGYFAASSVSYMAKTASLYLKLYSKCYGFKIPEVLLGIRNSLDYLNGELYEVDDISCITELKVPVLLISGENDMVCPVCVTQQWFDNLTAPKKDFVKIKNAAHMVNFEQPQEWNRLVRELRIEN